MVRHCIKQTHGCGSFYFLSTVVLKRVVCVPTCNLLCKLLFKLPPVTMHCDPEKNCSCSHFLSDMYSSVRVVSSDSALLPLKGHLIFSLSLFLLPTVHTILHFWYTQRNSTDSSHLIKWNGSWKRFLKIFST